MRWCDANDVDFFDLRDRIERAEHGRVVDLPGKEDAFLQSVGGDLPRGRPEAQADGSAYWIRRVASVDADPGQRKAVALVVRAQAVLDDACGEGSEARDDEENAKCARQKTRSPDEQSERYEP